jgi:para-nitrobenzyl esterase
MRRQLAVEFVGSVFATLATIAWITGALAQARNNAVPNDPVATESGSVAGQRLASGVRTYLGIPYAAPPNDDARWRPPGRVHPWQGVLNADRFRPECMQARPAHSINHYFGEEATSEDCLYLNVYSPAATPTPGSRNPVIFWIHGGGFIEGSPSMPFYRAEGLARKGAVFVSAAYRLGVLGFLSHPELSAESEHHSSGNFGLLDQIAALQWIQRNIERFGGDPANVTIMGQSAGSMSVAILQASPVAKGLFHRAVGLSASTFGQTLAPLALSEAELAGTKFQSAIGASSLAHMRNMPADKIIAAAPPGRPVIDGYVITGRPDDVFAHHRQSDVPLIVGFTSDEGFSRIASARSIAAYRDAIAIAYGANANTVFNLYPASTDSDAGRTARELSRDSTVSQQMYLWARAQAEFGRAPVYAYMFSRANLWGVTMFSETPDTPGAYHSGDLPYWLGSVDALQAARPSREWSETDLELVDRMTSMLVEFSRSGNPNGGGAVVWPRFDRSHEQLMSFGDSVGAKDWPNLARLHALEKLDRSSSR